MIAELAAQLAAETTERINYHEAEIARLTLLRESLEAFIAQPAAGQGAPDPSPSPATDQPGSARSGQRERRRPRRRAPAATAAAAPSTSSSGSAGTPTPASPLTCSKCGRDGFTKRNGLAMHEKHCDGIGTQRIRIQPEPAPELEPEPEPEPVPPAEPTPRLPAPPPAPGRFPDNARSVPPLDLPPRRERFPGE